LFRRQPARRRVYRGVGRIVIVVRMIERNSDIVSDLRTFPRNMKRRPNRTA
jgi:hypothetical protein